MFQRHPIQNDAILFITTNTAKRRKVFGESVNAREAIETLYRVQELHPFILYAFVIMPDHCHLLMRPIPPIQVSTIMRVFKSGVSFNLGIGPIWQTRFHLQEVESVTRVIQYIHNNPVRAGFAESAEKYPWSSASGRWEITEWGCL